MAKDLGRFSKDKSLLSRRNGKSIHWIDFHITGERLMKPRTSISNRRFRPFEKYRFLDAFCCAEDLQVTVFCGYDLASGHWRPSLHYSETQDALPPEFVPKNPIDLSLKPLIRA